MPPHVTLKKGTFCQTMYLPEFYTPTNALLYTSPNRAHVHTHTPYVMLPHHHTNFLHF